MTYISANGSGLMEEDKKSQIERQNCVRKDFVYDAITPSTSQFFKNEEDLKNEVDLKNEDDFKMRTTCKLLSILWAKAKAAPCMHAACRVTFS